MVTTFKPVKALRTYQPRQETNIADLWTTSFPTDVLWGNLRKTKHPGTTCQTS
jgi:hypothetical protein